MSDRFVDRQYLTGVQYASDANLASRQALYRFQRPRIDNPRWALDLVRLRGDECVLDVGCGNGVHLAELAARAHSGEIHGMDISAGMLTAARSRSLASLLVGDAQELPFRENAFDVVLAMHMLYHVPDRDRAIAEMRRVLRSGGFALALTNSGSHLAELNDLLSSVADAAGVQKKGAKRAYFGFSSESGGAELSRHFATVERHDVRSELVVTDVAALVAYVRSMSWVGPTANDASQPFLQAVEQRVGAMIENEGALRIRTEVGCFVCR